MRKLSKAALLGCAAILISASHGCKKGENDPFISLRTRKARVAGEWTVHKMTKESSFASTSSGFAGSGSSNSGTTNSEIKGNSASMSSTDNYQSGTSTSSESQTGSGTVKATALFEKDGSFTLRFEYTDMTITSVRDGSDQFVYMQDMSQELSGTWNFLGGVEKDYKNKERLILNILKETTTETLSADGATQTSHESFTYSNGAFSEIWHITQLKNKELLLESTISGTGNYAATQTSGGLSYPLNGTSTHSGKNVMTLVQ